MNQDYLRRFPNQSVERRGTECVGETVADLIGNLSGTPMDAGFNYAMALKVMAQPPTTAGSDPYAGMLGGMIYGGLPTGKVPFDVDLMDELYEANWANYPQDIRELAQYFGQNGVKSFYSYQQIVDWLSQGKGGVSLALNWYQNFNIPQSNGLLTEPAGQFTRHNAALYEVTPIGFRIKPWLGGNYGAGGYCYLNERVFDEVWLGAFAFDPQAWRWLNLLQALSTRWKLFSDIYPQVKR